MQIKYKIIVFSILLLFFISGKTQITQDLRNLDWVNNKGYKIYGNIIIPIFGQISDNKMTTYGPRTNIAYKSSYQLINDLKYQAENEKWDSIKLKDEINTINKNVKGGRIYLYLDRTTNDLANLRYFFSIIRDMDEKEIFSINFKQNEPYLIIGGGSASEVTFDINKEVPDSFYVYVNDRQTGELSDYKFKVITAPKMEKYVSYYKNNQVFTEGILEYGIQTGKWIKYHPNGKEGVIEYYHDGKLNGKKLEYYDDGSIAAEKEFKNGYKHGIWKQYYYKIIIDGKYKEDKKDSIWNFYDTIGNLTATGPFLNDLKNGKWTYYVDNRPESEGNYLDDLENGEWFIYNTKGDLAAKGLMDKGKEVTNSWSYYLGKDKITLDTNALMILDTMPKFRGGDKEYILYLQNNLKFSPATIEKKLSGKVYISFIVEPNGTLSNIIILKGLSTEIDNEIIRVFSSMPRWLPGTQNGHLARVKVVMPIQIGD